MWRRDVHTSAVAMFCGPHDEGDRVVTRRIDRAIEIARCGDLPLFIAGDACGGEEVRAFQLRAWNAGVPTAVAAFDARSCTLADAQAIAQIVRAHAYRELERLHLVTDWWHMERALAMLEGELARIVRRRVVVVPESVFTGPAPTRAVHDNERQGLVDYRAGIYGLRRVADPLCHRLQAST